MMKPLYHKPQGMRSMWIGLTAKLSFGAGMWRWSDESENNFDNWAPDEPNGYVSEN